MSIEAMVQVLKYEVGDPTRKLVLLAHANHAHSDGSASWISVDSASGYAECSSRTVQRHTARLVLDGFMREGDQRLVAHLPGNRRPIVYDVAMTEGERQEWARIAALGEGRREAAAQAGRRGAEMTNATRGDRLSPHSELLRGDTGDQLGATPVTVRGDTRVGETVLEPSLEPSLFDARAPREPKPGRGTRLPDDWTPVAALWAWTQNETARTPVQPLRELDRFRDHWHSQSGAKGVKSRWDLTWRNWIREAVDRAARQGRSSAARAAQDERPEWLRG